MNPATTSAVEEFARKYDEAWNSHDIDRILAFNAEDMTFRVHLPGFGQVSGEENLREHFAQLLTQWPDLEFRSRRVTAAEGMFANEMEMAGTLATPLPIGDLTLIPNGQRVAFESVDVIVVDDGQIRRKDTYIDSASLLLQQPMERG